MWETSLQWLAASGCGCALVIKAKGENPLIQELHRQIEFANCAEPAMLGGFVSFRQSGFALAAQFSPGLSLALAILFLEQPLLMRLSAEMRARGPACSYGHDWARS